jgi:hypothetical protein
VGFVAGLFAPSTKFEDEKLGPISDQVKSQAADVGGEALEHGKQVAQAAAESAVETAKQEGKEHGEELSSSVQDKAREAARVDNEPLEQSYIRLQQVVIRLKTEMSLLDLPSQGEAWKKLNADLNTTEGLLNKVTSALERQQAAKDKARDKETSERRAFEVSAYEAEAREAVEVALSAMACRLKLDRW